MTTETTGWDRGSSRPYLIVSGDSHAGPSLEQQLRRYCPKGYLEQFDEFVVQVRARSLDTTFVARFRTARDDPDTGTLSAEARAEGLAIMERARRNPGSQDPLVRLADMDADGIASELIFADAQNNEVLPWVGGFDAGSPAVEPELRVVGGHIWNEWLADFCSVAPERLLGVMQIPIWDVDAAIREVQWGAEHGLRAINFAAPRADYPAYNQDVYEPFWDVVEEVGLPLVTHSGSGEPASGMKGRGKLLVWMSEVLWLSRRGLCQLIFGGVFDRHPRLKVVFVEQRGHWVLQQLEELDSVYLGAPNAAKSLLGAPIEAPKLRPSEYWSRHCIEAVSFMAPFEAAMRHEVGLHTIMWGTDYPHLEGTWPRTRLALRNTFAGVPEPDVRVILGENAVRVFNLDLDVLRPIAQHIGPTPEELATPLAPDELPHYRSLAFREAGSFH